MHSNVSTIVLLRSLEAKIFRKVTGNNFIDGFIRQ